MNATPEAPIENEGDHQSFSEKWYQKWVELFQSFLGVKNLEEVVESLASEGDKQKVVQALLNLEGEEKTQERAGFVGKLLALLRSENDVSSEIETLIDTTLNIDTDPDAKDVLGAFIEDYADESHGGEEFEVASQIVEKRKTEALDKEVKKLENVGANNVEIENVRRQIDFEVRKTEVQSEEEAEEQIKNYWEKQKDDLEIEEVSRRRKTPKFSNATKMRALAYKKAAYEKALLEPDKLTKGELQILEGFLIDLYANDRELFEMMMDRVLPAMDQDSMIRVMSEGVKVEQEEYFKNHAQHESSYSNSILNKQLERMLFARRGQDNNRDMADWDENDWEQVRVSGMLNIDVAKYPALNALAKKELGLRVNPLVVDAEKKIAKVNSALTEDEKKLVDKFFAKKLLSNVRFLVDESVRLDPNTPDLRATEYVTIMSIMGLSTSMKSDIMNSARRMTFAFLVFNTPQTEDGYRQLKEYSAQIGPEYSVLSRVMKLREAIVVKDKEGKEFELTDLSQLDFVNAAAQAITDEEDRKHYGLSLDKDEKGNYKVGRLYSDMMMASNLADVRKEDWVPVTRMVLKERLGASRYEEKMREYKVLKDDGTLDKDLEKHYLEQIGKQYWDYYNGIYTYFLMTRASGEFVANANPTNNRLETPAGLNENFNYKMDPSAWMTFLNTYDVQNFPEAAQMFRFNGNSSLAAKEGGEVLSYLVETKKSGVKKIPSIEEAWYAKGIAPDQKSLAKLRAVFVDAIFLPDQYHLHGKSHELEKETKLYESLPLKYDADGNLKLDPTAQRRDFATARKKMESGLRRLYAEDPTIFAGMDFEFIKKTFAHDEVLMEALSVHSHSTNENFEKLIVFAQRWGEDKLILENLSNKRPDDFTKYAIDYHKEWQQAATALGTKPTWGAFIKMMGVSQRILGKGAKIEPIALRAYEYMVELRKARVVGEKYVRQIITKDGALSFEHGNYIGELPGRVPVPDLEIRKVTYDDKQANNGKSPSIVSISGFPGEVDEEGVEQEVLSSMRAASIITEKTYKHERKHLRKSILGWHSDRPPLAELWDTVTGKKLITYLALEVFHMPPEYFMEFVVGATGDFFGLWWKYLNGTGAPSHH